MTEWRELALGDVVTLINGDRGSNYPSAKHRTTSGIPFINAGLLVEGRVRPVGDNFIAEERFNLLRSGRVAVDDILLCIRGSIGRVALATPEVVPSAIASSLVILRPGADVNPRFLLALLQSPAGQHQITASDNGVAQPNLGAREVARFRFRIPDRSTQDGIAAVLGAFDDLIENARRRAKLLEEMSQAIYQEWFVDFRYRGHQEVSLVDSPLGLIPETWEVATVADVADPVTRGVAPKYAEDGQSLVINQKCIRDGRVSLDKARRQERPVPDRKRVRRGDVLINSTGIGTLGRAALCLLSESSLTVDTHVTIVRPSLPSANPWFGLGLVARHTEFEQLGTGSTGQTELSRIDIGAMRIVVPPESIRSAFADAVWPQLDASATLVEQAMALASLRDLLLPRLVSGKIDVSHLDLCALAEAAVA